VCQHMLGSTRGYCAEWAGAPSGEPSDLEHVVQGRLHYRAFVRALGAWVGFVRALGAWGLGWR
jgi:hypothetical protein